MNRFQEPGLITVRPGDASPVYIGDFSIGEGHDTIWCNVTSSSDGECPWPWSYGLLTWVTERGRELGTVKINGVCEGEVFRLGVGLSPSFRTGRMEFTPRNYNLKWIELGHPWTLSFEFFSGKSASGGNEGGAGGELDNAVVANSFVRSTDGSGLSFVQVDFS